MKKLASSLFLVVLLAAPIATPAFAVGKQDRDGGAITKLVRSVRSFFRTHSLGDLMSPPLP